MSRAVDITFDCLPLRSVGRLDIPLDASPKYRQRCERVKAALEKHGALNSYYLYNARCVFHLTNRDDWGMLEFSFEGSLLTNADDSSAERCDLTIELQRETCPWITEPAVAWFRETVKEAVRAEFDRYIAVGDLEQTKLRIEKIRAASDQAGGFVGMYL